MIIPPNMPLWQGRLLWFTSAMIHLPAGVGLVVTVLHDDSSLGLISCGSAIALGGVFSLFCWWKLKPDVPAGLPRRLQRQGMALALLAGASLIAAVLLFSQTSAYRPSFAELAPALGFGVVFVVCFPARLVVGWWQRRSLGPGLEAEALGRQVE